jgi:hypothetical protein
MSSPAQRAPSRPQAKVAQSMGSSHRPRPDKAPIVRIERWRPTARFIAWIRGYTVVGLSRSMQVERKTIYRWLAGECPPHRDFAVIMAGLSRLWPVEVGPLTLEDILGVMGDP